ncbi:MAG TPA: sulfotransferase [Rhodanobacteraceae bacterium]|nr:sulfotransferase [Rhodanobacteraceae bacterium]
MSSSRLQGLSQAAIPHVLATAQALEMGRPDEAATRIAPLLQSDPRHPEVLRLHAGLLDLRGRPGEAARIMQAAIAQRPDDPLYYNTLGAVLGSCGDYEGAIAALRRACELQPSLATAWFNLGVMLTRSVRHAEAIEALRRAVTLDPAHMDARALLADMLRMEDRVDEAIAAYRHVLERKPWTGMAWWGLAALKTMRLNEGDVGQMRRAMRDSRATDHDLVAIGFALAKALDDEGRYAESLAALEHANSVARRSRRWDAKAFDAQMDLILQAFTPPPHGAARELGRGMIFIVGLPRSGSTLVEQIFASHSQVAGSGELPDLPLVLASEAHRVGKPFPQWAADAQPADWQRLGQTYLQRTAHWRGSKPALTDKLPGNWMYIGAIRAMLPGAHVIVCRRDPVETCFSCYRQYLENNDYQRTFEDLAAFWHTFDRTATHWQMLHTENVYTHVYEDLIADPESSIRALLNRCGLPFEQACLDFHQTRRDVRSPSATQVRQPLRRDTAHANRYGALLDPLRKALDSPAFVD